jgi:hypothetical protein
VLLEKGNKYYIFLCECVCVALVVPHATRMLFIILLFESSLAHLYFSTLSNKRHDFRKKHDTENKTCVFIFSTTFI